MIQNLKKTPGTTVGKKKAGFLLLLALGALVIGAQGCGGSIPPSPAKPGGLQVGDKAPDFALMDSDGKIVKTSDIQPGWYLVVIFYRGSWCSGCQNELLDLKKYYPRFAPLHAALVTVSADGVEESAAFNRQWRFPFPLLSDTRLAAINAFGVRQPNGHAGKDIALSSTFIIDPQKIIRYKYLGQGPWDQPTGDELIATLRKLQTAEKNGPLPASGS